jgi:murein L,D-transpeptidase YcbB/YkuD
MALRQKVALLGLVAILAGCRHQLARPGAGERQPLPFAVGQRLRATIDARSVPAGLRGDAARRETWAEMRRFYRKRLFLPAWSDAGGPLPRAEELLHAIDAVAADALDPRRFRSQDLARMIGEARAATRTGRLEDPVAQRRIVDLDVHLTCAYLTIARQLATGRLRPQALAIHWFTRPRRIESGKVLGRALAADAEITPTLAALAPSAQGYVRLRQALAAYRALAARGGWPRVPPGGDLGPGAQGPRVTALRARLAATGDLPPAPATGAEPEATILRLQPPGPQPAGARQAVAWPASARPAGYQPASDQPAGARPAGAGLYDRDVAAAVAHFRARHGLAPGENVDAETLQELNVPVEERIRQIEVNMERWRWLPGELGSRYVLVNVPDFRLQVVEAGRVVLAMRVIVGKAQSETPVFSDRLTQIVLNPAWALPDSIVAKEIVPKAAGDPGYLRRKGLQAVRIGGEDAEKVDAARLDRAQIEQLGRPGSPYHLRQPPGGDNPLGKIKFLFPNRFDVYLHDTPSGQQFASSERDFSHGCIRLENPFALADYLLAGDPRWNPPAVAAAVAGGQTTTIAVPRPLPVHILYWTAWADGDGTVQFRRDVYGHDATLAAALDSEPPLWFQTVTARGKSLRLTATAAGDARRVRRAPYERARGS